ncbi:MAG: dihydrodipicolinate synthase family protein [Xanthobacteraceae bacterium]
MLELKHATPANEGEVKRPEKAAGIWVPAATPFRANLSIDYERYIAHCKKLLDDGAHGLAVLGTTSEANSLDLGERETVLERLVKADVSPDQLLLGTGAPSIGDTARLTRHAVALGVRGVLLLPPYYYKNVSDEGLYAFVAEVIRRVNDKRLAIYLYNFPQMTAISWSPVLVGLLIHDFPDTVVGLKDSSGQIHYMETLLEQYPGFAVFPSSEAILLRALRKGAAGCISATANTHVTGIRWLYDGWQGPDAQALHEVAAGIREAVQPFGWIPAVKTILAAREGMPDWARVRPPLDALNDEQTKELLAAVAAVGG